MDPRFFVRAKQTTRQRCTLEEFCVLTGRRRIIRNHPIENFDPLLHDLVSYELVAAEETEAGRSWQLTDAVQSRLDELVERRLRRPVLPEKLVYFDHLCAECHRRAPTRLRSGAYVCDPCARRHADDAANLPRPGTEPS